MKRRHIVRALLVAGCVGLMCGVAVLVRMSVDEYDDVLAQLAREREAVRALARHDLEDVLHGALDGARGELAAARSSYFVKDNLFERRGDQVTYPPPVHFGTTSRLPGLAGLTASDGLPSGDWSDDARERWRLATGAPLDIDTFLDHRARYRVPVELDIAATLAAFERTGVSDVLFPAELGRQVVRDGVVRADGRLEGLMGLLLAARERFSEADFMALARRVSTLGKRYLVRVDDFDHEVGRRTPNYVRWVGFASLANSQDDDPANGHCASKEAGSACATALDIAVSRLAPGRRLVTWSVGETEESWAVEVVDTIRQGGEADPANVIRREATPTQRGEDGLRTVLARRLEPDWLDELAGRLVAADLIDLEAEVGLAPDGRSVLLESPRWRAEVARAERRLWLKGIPAGTIALLGLAVTIMAFTLQRRREAYIRLRASLLTAVTHELKTPLASIRAMAETLERRLEDDPRARDYPRRIVRSSERLGFLVDNILSFARLDREAWKLQRALVPLNDLVARVRERAEAMAPRGEGIGHLKPARFEVDTGDLVLEVDPELVQLLLANLVDNAMRYAVRDEVRVRIHGRLERGRTVVRFSDDGPGMNEPTTQTRAVGGTGLGLVLCRLIMELHGGAMRRIQSDEPGTTFELEFTQGRPPQRRSAALHANEVEP